MDKTQIRELIRWTLGYLDMWSPQAERLVMATGQHESHYRYLKQIKGPALGFWQMEPDTLDDLCENYLVFKADLAEKFDGLRPPSLSRVDALQGCLFYACAACRLHYYRFPEQIPTDDDGLWDLYKFRYNSPAGAATKKQFFRALAEIDK